MVGVDCDSEGLMKLKQWQINEVLWVEADGIAESLGSPQKIWKILHTNLYFKELSSQEYFSKFQGYY